MPKKQAPKRQKRIISAPKACAFCESKTEPYFADTKALEKYITERGKLLSRARTGLCSLHQRRVTLSVKQARVLALLPFIARV